MVKVKYKTGSIVKFRDLDPGDTFLHHNHLFFALPAAKTMRGDLITSVCLDPKWGDSWYSDFRGDRLVEKVDITIEVNPVDPEADRC